MRDLLEDVQTVLQYRVSFWSLKHVNMIFVVFSVVRIAVF